MHYSYCPVCGKPIGSRARDVLDCGSCGYHFYLNSKPCVAALIVRPAGGFPSLLLTRRGVEPYKGQWDLPGGFLGNGEHPYDGLVRELEEELGVAASNIRFFALEMGEYPRDDIAEESRHILCLFYFCDIPAGASLVPADDVTEARWFSMDRIPFELAFPGNRSVLEKARALLTGQAAE